MKKSTNNLIIFICFFLIVLLGIITYQAVTFNQNWIWSIDFKNENEIISSYGALSASIISLLSVILLIYTIFTQLIQFKKQTKQLNKQLDLQKEQFEIEKRKNEYDERKEMYFQLKFVDVYVESFIRHIEIMSKEIHKYFNFEKKNPLLHSNLSFNINKDAETLSKIDVLSLFKTFQFFFENDGEKWVKKFNDLFGIISFYNDILEEMLISNKNHVKEKYNQKVIISFEINSAIQNAQKIVINYRKVSSDFEHLPYYKDIETLVYEYNMYLKNNENKESEFDFISQNIFHPFIENVIEILQNPDEDKYGLIEVLNQISAIRKKIYFIKTTANVYSKNMENRFNEYFVDNNSHIKRLKEIHEIIHLKLSEITLNDLK